MYLDPYDYHCVKFQHSEIFTIVLYSQKFLNEVTEYLLVTLDVDPSNKNMLIFSHKVALQMTKFCIHWVVKLLVSRAAEEELSTVVCFIHLSAEEVYLE